jgi:DNA-binding CsgD family transcriptional regulator
LGQRRVERNPSLLSCSASLSHCRGILSESVDDLKVAAMLYKKGPRPLAYASSLEDLGRVLTRQGENVSAIEAFDEALTLTTAVGADWDSARIRARLRRLGIRRRPSRADRPKTGLNSLTATEAAVARLAAAGNTDKQIAEKLYISPHTAHTHLRHIFEKLGVNSRLHLTRLVGTDNASSPRQPKRLEE